MSRSFRNFAETLMPMLLYFITNTEFHESCAAFAIDETTAADTFVKLMAALELTLDTTDN